MIDPERNHWFKDHKTYWTAFLLLIVAQAQATAVQTPWPLLASFLIFFGAYLILNVIVSVIILLLTWPAKRNLHFSRYIKILIAFSAVYFLSQLIALLVSYFRH